MQELDDRELLRRYLDQDSEEAFTALVNRHVHMIYSVALRHCSSLDAAQEITQAVFVILARKARTLTPRVVIAGWLYNTARLTAITFNRANLRRARREEQSLMPTDANAQDEPQLWTDIAPMLDAAMAALNRTDRETVILSYFENKSIKQVGDALGASQEAAKKRLSRALEKLRLYFAKRGIDSTTAFIAGAIASNSVQTAPMAVVQLVGTSALAKAIAPGTPTTTLIEGTMKLMTWTRVKFVVYATTAVLAAAGGGVIAVKSVLASPTRAASDSLWAAYAEALSQSTNGTDAATRVSSIMSANPPMASIRLSPTNSPQRSPVGRGGRISGVGTGEGHLLLGSFLGQVVRYVNHLDPNFPQARIVVPGELLYSRFDYIDTMQQGGPEALRKALKEQLGLVARQEMRPNLVLRARNTNLGGLHQHSDAASDYRSSNVTMAQLAQELTRQLGVEVTDHTGLTGGYDYSLNLHYPFSGDELRNAVTNQLGLDLAPSGDGTQTEFWVLEKATR